MKLHDISFQTPYFVSVEDFFEVRFQLIMLCGLYEVQDGLYFATYEHIFRFLLHPTQYLEFLEGLFVSGSPGYFEGVEFDGF